MGHFLGFLKLNHLISQRRSHHSSTNDHIRASEILTAYLEDIDSVEWTVIPRKTLQDLCQDAIFKNSYWGNLGHLF